MKNKLAQVYFGSQPHSSIIGWWLEIDDKIHWFNEIPIQVLPSKLIKHVRSVFDGNFVIRAPNKCHCIACRQCLNFQVKITKNLMAYRIVPMLTKIKRAILHWLFPDVVELLKKIYSVRDASCAVYPPARSNHIGQMIDIPVIHTNEWFDSKWNP